MKQNPLLYMICGFLLISAFIGYFSQVNANQMTDADYILLYYLYIDGEGTKYPVISVYRRKQGQFHIELKHKFYLASGKPAGLGDGPQKNGIDNIISFFTGSSSPDVNVIKSFQEDVGSRKDGEWGSGTWMDFFEFMKKNHRKKKTIINQVFYIAHLNPIEEKLPLKYLDTIKNNQVSSCEIPISEPLLNIISPSPQHTQKSSKVASSAKPFGNSVSKKKNDRLNADKGSYSSGIGEKHLDQVLSENKKDILDRINKLSNKLSEMAIKSTNLDKIIVELENVKSELTKLPRELPLPENIEPFDAKKIYVGMILLFVLLLLVLIVLFIIYRAFNASLRDSDRLMQSQFEQLLNSFESIIFRKNNELMQEIKDASDLQLKWYKFFENEFLKTQKLSRQNISGNQDYGVLTSDVKYIRTIVENFRHRQGTSNNEIKELTNQLMIGGKPALSRIISQLTDIEKKIDQSKQTSRSNVENVNQVAGSVEKNGRKTPENKTGAEGLPPSSNRSNQTSQTMKDRKKLDW
ncbi:hypothetical protein [Desulfobacter latus]|uniref:Uncharacterized protein n=1 Tax=Desulfobacter latus TaxID=2292 RepID=A0A850TEQ3_9BACT|nr:hypothetical protein [Desulfobacter latus]NWH05906.1 hypothetical protein [Desulfobacter latus]